MKNINYNQLVNTLIETGAHVATKYIDDKTIVRATRRLYGYRKHSKSPWRKGENIEISLTIGRPNYAERQFIKSVKKSGESFPIRKIQLKFPPSRK